MQASNGARTEPAGPSILKYEQSAPPNGAVANNISYPSPTDAHRGGLSPTEAAHQALPHVYNDDAHTQARLQAAPADPESQIHPQLRSFQDNSSPYAPTPNMMPSAIPQQTDHSGQPGPSTPMMGAPAIGEDAGSSADGKGKKRELSTSKRAAQNRAAQRAFRQRKEGYIKQLETKVREYNDIEAQYKALEGENYALREYILNLSSRVLDLKGELPPPPQGLRLPHPHAPNALPQMAAAQPIQAPPPAAEDATAAPAAIPQHPLAQVAQAVGGHLQVGENRDLKYEPSQRGGGQDEAMADGLPAGSE